MSDSSLDHNHSWIQSAEFCLKGLCLLIEFGNCLRKKLAIQYLKVLKQNVESVFCNIQKIGYAYNTRIYFLNLHSLHFLSLRDLTFLCFAFFPINLLPFKNISENNNIRVFHNLVEWLMYAYL